MMITVSLQEFVRHPAQYVEQVKKHHEVIAVLQEGEEIVRLVSPAQQKREVARARLQEWAKEAKIGDVISPVDEQWDALSRFCSIPMSLSGML